jgi:1,4-alpha-glucan branching enzyme
MTSIRPDGRIEFRFYRPGAVDVKIVGTFNNWNEQAHPMRSTGDGWWTAHAMLDAGEHHFRYVADGHWFTDFAANGVERNKHGWNSILIVPERAAERTLRMPMPVDNFETDGQDEAIAA